MMIVSRSTTSEDGGGIQAATTTIRNIASPTSAEPEVTAWHCTKSMSSGEGEIAWLLEVRSRCDRGSVGDESLACTYDQLLGELRNEDQAAPTRTACAAPEMSDELLTRVVPG